VADYDPRGLSKWLGPERVAVGRKVDLDLLALSREERGELELDVDRLDIPGLKTLSTPLPLGRRGKPYVYKKYHGDLLTDLQREAGRAFGDGDEWMRSVYILAWHRVLARLDLWPYYPQDMWRLYRLKTSDEMEWDDPYTIATEVPYGRYVYDSFESVYELERYYAMAWLRCAEWARRANGMRFTVTSPTSKKAARSMYRAGGPKTPAERVGSRGIDKLSIEGKMYVAIFERLQDVEEWTRIRTGLDVRALSYCENGGRGVLGSYWNDESGDKNRIIKLLFSFSEMRIRLSELGKIRTTAQTFLDGVNLSRPERKIANTLIRSTTTQTQRLSGYYSDLFVLAARERTWEQGWFGIS